MLYITTRSDVNTYTANKALKCDFAPDGGQFVPFRIPQYTPDEIAALKEKTFCQTVAEILNMFFSARLDPSELELRIGRNNIRVASINHKIVVAELWHNLEGNFFYIEGLLHQVLVGDSDDLSIEWVWISVKIAMLFAVYGELLRNECITNDQSLDISVANDDLETPMAAWYCRAMGLPVNMIICACVDNSNLWDFVHRGTISTTLVSKSLQRGIERLLQAAFGCEEALKFYRACENRDAYSVREEMLPQLNQGLFCSVAGEDRVNQTVNSVFRSNAYIMNPQSALGFTGLQDYRAKTGKSELTLLLAERTPKDFVTEICESTGIHPDKINDYIDHF